MTDKFNRRVVCVIGTKLLNSNLTITFAVSKLSEQARVKTKLQLYNINEDTLTLIAQAQSTPRGIPVRLETGYEGDSYATVFDGYIQTSSTARVANDMVTTAYCYSWFGNRVNPTIFGNYAAGDSVANVLNSSGVPARGDAKFSSKGYFSGAAESTLAALGASHNFTWRVDNNEVVVAKDGSRTVNIFNVSASTGLLGVPEVTEAGVNVTTLMEPRIQPGDRIEVQSSRGYRITAAGLDARVFSRPADGIYRVIKVVHSGASRKGPHNTSLEAFRY